MTWPMLLLLIGGWMVLLGVVMTLINIARWWYSR